MYGLLNQHRGMGMGMPDPFVPQRSMGLLAQAQQPTPDMLGSGQAQKAAQALDTRQAYLQYVEQQQMAGNQALAYPEWVKMMQAQVGTK